MKRLLLFLAILAIVPVLRILAPPLGLDQYLAVRGGRLDGLLLLAPFFAFAGAARLISINRSSLRGR
jgi:hypothetical protein